MPFLERPGKLHTINLIIRRVTMATKKTAKKENSTEKLGDMVKDLYLANLGVYGKLYETLEDKVEEYNDKRGDLFKELVKRGEKVHKTAEKRLKDAQQDAEKRIKDIDLVKDMNLDDRIKELRENFRSVKDKLVPAAKKKAPATKKSPAKTKARAAASKAKAAVEEAAEQVAA